ncbi:MAG: SRPBCC domain-containing protein [Chitinophagaceae bacterium]|nr:MAG: SRPBCC domain-containing protein [Chitinophagaceae bacterium]
MTNNFEFEADLAAKKIHVTREFNAPIGKVWRAWTEPDLLEKWTVLKHWTAITKTMEFYVGGVWLYAMVSPEGQKHWVYAKFTAIENLKAISTLGRFTDTDGNPIENGPTSNRDTRFVSLEGNRSKVEMTITFEEESTLRMFVEGGFKEGLGITLEALDELLEVE